MNATDTDTDTVRRSYQAEIDDVSPGDRSVVAVVNTADMDRFKTVISPAGIDLAAYRKNPVVLWEHGLDPARGALPVGRNLWIKADKGKPRLIAKTQFAKGDEFSEGLFRLYQDEVLRAFSVNIIPAMKECSPPTRAERSERPELADCVQMYRRSELAEYSSVAVPGNAEALTLAVSRGLWMPDRLRSAAPEATPTPEPEVPHVRGRSFAEALAAMRAEVALALGDPGSAARDAVDYLRGRV